MWSRRQFIKALGVLGGAVAAPLHRLGRVQAATFQDAPLPPGAELYGGFLLLPEGAPVPAMVKPPRLPPFNECGVDVSESGPKPNAVIKFFNSAEELAKEVGFPLYAFSKLPDGLRLGHAFVTSNHSGDTYSTSLGFETYNPRNNLWETTVSIWAQPDFAKPLPLWASGPVEPGGPAVVLEKVNFLPALGIRVITPIGYVCHWIERDIFYTLIAEPSPAKQSAETLVGLLASAGDMR